MGIIIWCRSYTKVIMSYKLNDPVGGDLSGTEASATVIKLQGHSVSSSAPASANILMSNGTSLAPVAVSQDISISSSGAVTVTGINGSILPTATVGQLMYN